MANWDVALFVRSCAVYAAVPSANQWTKRGAKFSVSENPGQSSGGFSATSQLQLREALPQSIHMFDGNGVPIIHAQVVLPAEGAGCELLEWLQAFEPTIRSSELKVFSRIFHLRHSAEGTGQNRGLCTFHRGGWT